MTDIQLNRRNELSNLQCVLGGWYAVNLDGDENNTKRAIAQAVLDDGNSYMMWFSDEDFMSSVPMTSIFEIENVDEVYNIPSQVCFPT